MFIKSFLGRFQIENLVTALRTACVRFPLAVLCCLAGTVLCMLEVHDVKLDDALCARLLTFLSLAAMFFVSARLYAEGTGLKAAGECFLVLAGAALLAGAAFLPAHFSTMHVFLGAALALSTIFAPYIGRESTEDSVWYFNYCNGIALAVAVISAFIFCLGVSAIVGSMDYLLFDMSFNKKVYAHIWLFGYGFLGPVAFLHQVSRQFDFEKSECAMPGGGSFIANYFVVPLLLIYTWVLYAYFLKIAITWELPKGSLAWMVTGFGSLGIAARLSVFPMRDTGTALLRQFYKHFYWLLAVPVVLLALGLYTRISQYGVTEDRYAIGICLVWLAALCGYALARPKKAHIKHVPMVLSLLFLLGAAGPWGVGALSTHSQTARLEALLEKAGVIGPGGEVSKTARDVPFEDRQNISSIVDYLYSGNKYKAIAHLTAPFAKEISDKGAVQEEEHCRNRFTHCWWGTERSRKLMVAWGMQYASEWQTESTGDGYAVHANFLDSWSDNAIVRIAPYEYLLRVYVYNYAGRSRDWETLRVYKEGDTETLKLYFTLDRAGKFFIRRKEGEEEKALLVFDLKALLEKLHAEKVTQVKEEDADKITLRKKTDGLKAEIRLSELGGRVHEGRVTVETARMIVLLSR